MTDQLSLYNGAIRHLKQRRLATLTDECEPRRVLDDVWTDGARNFVLEQGEWKWAIRSARIDYSSSVQPPFGYRYAFPKPADWLRTAAIACDEYFVAPLNAMVDENDFWFADQTPIYVKWVSNATSFGLDYSKWAQSFTLYVECYLAWLAAPRILKSNDEVDAIFKRMEMLLVQAREKDSLNGPAMFPPPGSWVSSRAGWSFGDRSRWNGQIISR